MRRRAVWQFADLAALLRRSTRWFCEVFVLVLLGRRRQAALKKPRFGREDEVAEAEPKPPVLTDQICLIPGDAPIVRVEDAPGNARRIFTGVDIRANVEDVWAVMTNYETLVKVVPNLVQNEILGHWEDGGARLWQVGRASWRILGQDFYFQAGATLDVHLFPSGLPDDQTAGSRMDAATSAEVRDYDRTLPLVRDIFPRPFSISVSGVPVHDITMQNVLGMRGDFVHYRGVWRLQPLIGCAAPGEEMMRLTFAVECQPHWFLPVAPVEGRIAHALVENMEAIRDYVEAQSSQRQREKTNQAATREEQGPESSGGTSGGGEGFTFSIPDFDAAAEALKGHLKDFTATASSWLPKPALEAQQQAARLPSGRLSLQPAGTFVCGRRGAFSQRRPRSQRPATLQLSPAFYDGGWARMLFEVQAGADAEAGVGALGGFAAAAGDVSLGIEAETWAMAVVAAAAALWAAERKRAEQPLEQPPPPEGDEEETSPAQVIGQSAAKQAEVVSSIASTVPSRVWEAVEEQHAHAVRDGAFLGVPFSRADVERRWPRFVQALGISQEEALDIIESDVTPLLVESEDVSEVLSRLAAISSKEKAVDLVGWHPGLLVGWRAGHEPRRGFGVSAIIDVLYAGRLLKVLEEGGRDNAGKLAEIEMYSYVMSSLKPLVDILMRGAAAQEAFTRLIRRPLQLAARVVPNSAVRFFFKRLAAAPNPWAFLAGQTGAGFSITSDLAKRPSLASTILPHSPAILPHLPSIYARLSILEPHVPGIVRILDPYLEIVEPHLDRIMERMDEIEPHLPYILLHLDVLAKHCGPLLDHFDDLLPYASQAPLTERNLEDWKQCYQCTGGRSAELMEACIVDKWTQNQVTEREVEQVKEETSYLPQLIRYVDFFVPRLDKLAAHLPLVRPHLPHVIPYLDAILPYVDGFAKFPQASKNADVLIGYLGWMLRLPILPRILHIPLVPRLIAAMSSILPRWPIKGALERSRRRREEKERAARRKALMNVQEVELPRIKVSSWVSRLSSATKRKAITNEHSEPALVAM